MYRTRRRSWIPPAREWADRAWDHHPDAVDWIAVPTLLFLAWLLLGWNPVVCVVAGIAGLAGVPFLRGWWDWWRANRKENPW